MTGSCGAGPARRRKARHRSLLEAHTYCLCDGLVCDDAIMDGRNGVDTYSQPNVLTLGGEMRRSDLGV